LIVAEKSEGKFEKEGKVTAKKLGVVSFRAWGEGKGVRGSCGGPALLVLSVHIGTRGSAKEKHNLPPRKEKGKGRDGHRKPAYIT